MKIVQIEILQESNIFKPSLIGLADNGSVWAKCLTEKIGEPDEWISMALSFPPSAVAEAEAKTGVDQLAEQTQVRRS